MAGQHVIHDISSGWEIRHVAETGSTNADLLAAVEAGVAGDRTALRTDHQTAGRGRLDRQWSAPPGANLLVSLLFVELPPDPVTLTHLVGLAAVDAVERLATERSVVPHGSLGSLGERLGLKWPNDLLLDDRKLAGVLAQRSPGTGAVVVGLGLNVRWAPAGAASLVADLGLEIDPADLLTAILAELRVPVTPDASRQGRFEALHERYRRRLLTLDTLVRVELPAGRQVTGRAVDVDAQGRLVVDDDSGQRHVLDVGDVVHLRPG